MTLLRQLLGAVLLTVVLWPTAARAQFDRFFSGMAAMEGAGKPAVSGTGTAVVQRNPTHLRLYIQLLAKGKSLEDALAKLKERREAAVTQLGGLKVDKESVVFGCPSLSNAASAQKQQFEAMVMEQMRSRGKKVPKGLQTPQTFTVSATLTAQWALETESPEQLLLMAQGLQEKIKAADLAGAKELEKLAPEEQEFEEEASQMMNRYGQETPQPGQPSFFFVAVLPKGEREKAMTEAVANAKQHAAELAKAAGVELGPLIGVSGHCGGQSNFGNGMNSYDPSGRFAFIRQIAMEQGGEGPEGKPDEAISPDPGALKFACSATVQFQLGK